jgi:hypothetical protein
MLQCICTVFAVIVDVIGFTDLESLLLTPKFQEQTVLLCSGCSMRISDMKLLSFSQGEAPIPGSSMRELGHKCSLPVPDLPSQLTVESSRTQLKQKEKYDDTHADLRARVHEERPTAPPKGNHTTVDPGNFTMVCAWKEVPEIHRLFWACAASAVGGFQVCAICTAVSYLIRFTKLPQSQFQPLQQRDAGVTLEQWMLFCRECSLGFHLNLSNSELQQCFGDARCGIQENSLVQHIVPPRISLNLQQFTQCLVFMVIPPAFLGCLLQSNHCCLKAARAGLIYPFDWKASIVLLLRDFTAA